MERAPDSGGRVTVSGYGSGVLREPPLPVASEGGESSSGGLTSVGGGLRDDE